MPSSYSPNLRIELIASGEQGNTWGNTTNNNLGTLIESAISGYVELDNWTSNSCTLTALNGADDQARNMYLIVPSTITLSGQGEIIAPSVPKMYIISNYDNGGFDVEIKTASSVGTTIIPNGRTKIVVCDGVEFIDAVSAADSFLLGGDPVDNLEAATKQYVDTGLATKLNINGSLQMTGALLLYNTVPSASGLCAVPRAYLDNNFLQFTAAGSQTMSGPLILSGAPTTNLQAATKAYVDASIWTIPVAAATYTNSNVTVDSNGRITNITNGTGGGGGTLATVNIATAYGFTQKGSSGSTNLILQIGLDTTATGSVLYGASGGTIRTATAAEIVTAIGSTAVQNATSSSNASQLGGQPAGYYASSNPSYITALQVSKLEATATPGYVLTSNGTVASWAAPGGGGGGSVLSVSGTNTNGFTVTVANPTTTPNITIGTTLSTLIAGTGSGITAANATNVTQALGYTPVSTSGSYADPLWIASLAGSKITGSVANATTAATATNASQLGGQLASYYAASDPSYITALSVNKLSASVPNGSVLTSNGSTAYWASPTSGGTVTNVSGTGTNGFTISVSNPTTTPNIVIGTGITGLLAGNGSGIAAASATNIANTLGYTPVSTTGAGATGTWGINISGSAASASAASTASIATSVSGGSVNATSGTFSSLITANGGYVQIGNSASQYCAIRYDGAMSINGTGYYANITAANVGSYAPSLTGAGAYGNWTIFAQGLQDPTLGYTWGIGFGTSHNIGAYPDNSFSMGSSSNRFTAIYATSGTVNTSDAREKTNIAVSDLGLDFINTLTPRSYKWINRQNVPNEAGTGVVPTPGVRTHYGLIAQEVETALGGKDFAGFVYDPEDDHYGLRYDQFIAPLIKAIQELNAKVEALTAEVNTLKGA